MTKETIEKKIKYRQDHFFVLSEWQINYSTDIKYLNQSVINTDTKIATIYPTDEDDVNGYILHEILHVVVKASEESKLHNEQAVCDLEALIGFAEHKDFINDPFCQDLRKA